MLLATSRLWRRIFLADTRHIYDLDKRTSAGLGKLRRFIRATRQQRLHMRQGSLTCSSAITSWMGLLFKTIVLMVVVDDVDVDVGSPPPALPWPFVSVDSMLA